MGINKSQENEEQEMTCIAFEHSLHANTEQIEKCIYYFRCLAIPRLN
jgi:hypothetical protein